MARKRSTAEQIIGKRREAAVALAQGDPVAKVARRLGVTEQTAYRWRREDGGLRVDQAKRRKALERANARRKRLVADQALDPAYSAICCPGSADRDRRRRPRGRNVRLPTDESHPVAGGRRHARPATPRG